MQRLTEGFMLGDRYRLAERIAAGGMGDVWLVHDTVLQRAAAAKILRPTTASDEVFAGRFHTEARHAAGLTHPNIATVFDYGECEDLPFLIMEHVDGESLSAVLKHRGPIEPALVRSLLSQTALGLAAAHDARVIHRDIKPANILLTKNGLVKITDFGIARALDAVGHTRTGEIMGTPNYLSPEQALGRRATEAADLYALGVVGYELLTGRRPFDGETPVATVLAHLNDAAPALPPEVPDDLRLVVEQCLEKEPGKRPPSARAIAAALGVVEATNHWTSALSTVRDTQLGVDAWPTGGSTPRTPTLQVSPSARSYASMDWVKPGEQLRDLEELLANLDPRLNHGEYAIVSVTEEPDGVNPLMTLIEPEGVTMLLPIEEAHSHQLEFELPLAWITLGVYRAIGTQGYVPTLTTALAQARIASVAGVGRWHTHLFVPFSQAEQAMKVLRRLSRAHRDD